MKILYIAGRGRSGSTLLGNVLNEIDSFFHIGELRHVWQIAFLENRQCGCGKQIQECPFWSSILAETEAYLGSRGVTVNEIASAGSHLPTHSKLLFNLLLDRKLFIDREYTTPLLCLYNSIFKHLPPPIKYVVDSSKFPIHAYILKEVIDLDVSVIHLVRDPRATAYSWRKHVRREDFAKKYVASMPRHGAFTEAIKWEIWNRVIRLLFAGSADYHLVKYENFASRPRHSVDQILQWVDSDADNPVRSKSVELSNNHVLWGNPFRKKRGATSIYLDEKWRQDIETTDLISVNTIAYHGIRKYGFK